MAASEALWAAEMRDVDEIHSVEQLELKAQLNDFALQMGNLSAETHSSSDVDSPWPQISKIEGDPRLFNEGELKSSKIIDVVARDFKALDKEENDVQSSASE